MTDASLKALHGLRGFSALKWYVIPLARNRSFHLCDGMRKARASRNWDRVLAGLTNETWNGWALAISRRSAFWTTPGDTARRAAINIVLRAGPRS